MSYHAPEQPVLQLALDYLNTSQATVLAAEAVPAGIPWVEVGTPLIKAAGLDAVRAVRQAHPGVVLVADMKVMDAGRVEVEAAAKAGADVVMCLGAASDATVQDCIAGGKQHGVGIGIDLFLLPTQSPGLSKSKPWAPTLSVCIRRLTSRWRGPMALKRWRRWQLRFPFRWLVLVALPPRRLAQQSQLAPALSSPVAQSPKPLMPGPRRRKLLAVVAQGSAPAEAAVYARHRSWHSRRTDRRSHPNLSDAMHRGGAVHGLANMNPAANWSTLPSR